MVLDRSTADNRDHRARRHYEPPALRVFGSLSELTKGSNGTNIDGANGNKPRVP